MTESQADAAPKPPAPEPSDRLHRPPDEGPAPGGGSALDDDDQAADEEVGGG